MNTSLVFVSLRYGSVTKELGAISLGETRSIAIPIDRLAGPAATLRFTDYESGKVETIDLAMPHEFGYSEEASLQALVQEVAEAEDRATTVGDPNGARAMAEVIRSLILKLLGHRLANDPVVQALINQLEDRKQALERLAVRFVHEDAMMYRKQSMQGAHNLRAPMQAYVVDAYSDAVSKEMTARSKRNGDEVRELAEEIYRRAKPEDWARWRSLPVQTEDGRVRLAMENPNNGFVVREIEGAVKHRLRPIRFPFSEAELDAWRPSIR